jgi:hypothetical protein
MRLYYAYIHFLSIIIKLSNIYEMFIFFNAI